MVGLFGGWPGVSLGEGGFGIDQGLVIGSDAGRGGGCRRITLKESTTGGRKWKTIRAFKKVPFRASDLVKSGGGDEKSFFPLSRKKKGGGAGSEGRWSCFDQGSGFRMGGRKEIGNRGCGRGGGAEGGWCLRRVRRKGERVAQTKDMGNIRQSLTMGKSYPKQVKIDPGTEGGGYRRIKRVSEMWIANLKKGKNKSKRRKDEAAEQP